MDSTAKPTKPPLTIKPGLVEGLTSAYATLLKRLRATSGAFVRWVPSHKRAHEFSWLPEGVESLILKGVEVRIQPAHAIHSSINRMMTTAELNPYEREILYGYPYVIGFSAGKAIRAPLLTIPIRITPDGADLLIHPTDDLVRFNSLPFRSEHDSEAMELSLARLIESTPPFPVESTQLRIFCESVAREVGLKIVGSLSGQLSAPPAEPRSTMPLQLVDNAACFVAPKTSYFLVKDLEFISKEGAAATVSTALGWLLGTRPNEPTAHVAPDSRNVIFPFPSNPSQRRAATLIDDPDNRIVVVQGPPGTGKSLTIANLACHLIARGKRVLISSQKDKALEVVDELLRELKSSQLPMTLLRHDRESKYELKERLESIQKTRSSEDTKQDAESLAKGHESLGKDSRRTEEHLRVALHCEHLIATRDLELANAAGFFRRLLAKYRLRRDLREVRRKSPKWSDHYGEKASELRQALRDSAHEVLDSAAEHRTSDANKAERNHLREFAKLLGRDQKSFKNFRVFDRMKTEPDRCAMLLKILPCWIMTPDDVARLYPCTPGLFDVVIVDEASQCDLPSMTPVLYRAKQAIIAGDSKQMQARRFSYTSNQVASQAWREQGLDKLDPDGWLDPSKVDLLQLASIRLDEEAFLDEHYRSVPSIISFSNARWYRDRLRIMRDAKDRRVGDPDLPSVQLYRVEDGLVNPGTQENEREARKLIARLKELIANPGYADASIGIICLFEEQMSLIAEMVAEEIPEESRQAHNLVVVNPDGFQGDERDVVLYSLSYDAKGMDKAALSARQSNHPHIQGMLNVAFTRARDEVHIFHSAEIAEFGMASGEGAIRKWLEHNTAAANADTFSMKPRLEQADSAFEVEVTECLKAKGARVIPQYPSCGYSIDLVVELGSQRVAVECDGETWHLDEHGQLRIEDVQRQEVLERAGWNVIRIPYRGWRENSAVQVQRVLAELAEVEQEGESSDGSGDGTLIETEPTTPPSPEAASTSQATGAPIEMNETTAALFTVLRSGVTDRETAFRHACRAMGKARLGRIIRQRLQYCAQGLEASKVVAIEGDEIFVRDDVKDAQVIVTHETRARSPRRWSRSRARYSYGRSW